MESGGRAVARRAAGRVRGRGEGSSQEFQVIGLGEGARMERTEEIQREEDGGGEADLLREEK